MCRAFFILNQRRFSDECNNNYSAHSVGLYRFQNLPRTQEQKSRLLMEEYNQIQLQLIVCPWCYRTIEIPAEEESFTCPVCDRIITEDDIEYEEHKED